MLVLTNMMAAQNPTAGDAVDSPKQVESLSSLNIFFLLGAQNLPQAEQDRYLEELQNVVWDNFISYDIHQFPEVNQQEVANVLAKYNKANLSTEDKLAQQEEILLLLEKYLPNLEDIILQKALQLKQQLVQERLLALKEKYADNQQASQQLMQAENLLQQEAWSAAAEILNSLG